jgi:hypothetical protein
MKTKKLVLFIIKIKTYQRNKKTVNKNMKIKPVCTKGIWNMIIA